MKKIIAILEICLLCSQLYAQSYSCISHNPSIYHSDSLYIVVGEFVTPVIFKVNKYDIKTTPQLKEIVDSIINCKNKFTQILVQGSASPEGPPDWNMKLGRYRADALVSYIHNKTGLDYSMFRTYNLGEDWDLLVKALTERSDFPNRERILEIVSSETDNEKRKLKIRRLDNSKTWRRLIREVFPSIRNARLSLVYTYPKLAPVASDIALPEPQLPNDLMQPFPIPKYEIIPKTGWKIAVKNNLLFDAILVTNLGVEISPCTHWSFDIPVWYSPYDITPTRKIRLLAIQPEVRWWHKEAMKGHFIGLHTHVAGFNIAINDHGRYQDPNHALWGLGLSYGYAISIGKSKRWGLEFNLGAGFAQYKYDVYRNRENGPKFKSGADCYWGITRAGINISYKWSFPRKD